jgi:hypothetical protein
VKADLFCWTFKEPIVLSLGYSREDILINGYAFLKQRGPQDFDEDCSEFEGSNFLCTALYRNGSGIFSPSSCIHWMDEETTDSISSSAFLAEFPCAFNEGNSRQRAI